VSNQILKLVQERNKVWNFKWKREKLGKGFHLQLKMEIWWVFGRDDFDYTLVDVWYAMEICLFVLLFGVIC